MAMVKRLYEELNGRTKLSNKECDKILDAFHIENSAKARWWLRQMAKEAKKFELESQK